MSGVKEAAFMVCLALLITALVRWAAPAGLTKEMLRTVSGLFVLVLLAGAAGKAGTALLHMQLPDFAADTALAETVYRQKMSAAEGALYDCISGLLCAAEIDFKELRIFFKTTDNPAEDNIVLDRIRVTAAYASQRERARCLLQELFPGAMIEVEETDG